MKNLVLVSSLILALTISASSQGYNNAKMSINYNIGIPMGEFSDFINLASFRGLNIQVDYFLNDRVSIGGYFGWNGFYQKKARETYSVDNGALNGVRFNYLYQVPLYLKGQYLLSDEGNISPYVAMGVGTHYIEQETYIGYIGFATDHWKFGLAPELGAYMMMGQSGWEFKLAAAYHLTLYDENNISTLQNLGVNMGFNYDF